MGFFSWLGKNKKSQPNQGLAKFPGQYLPPLNVQNLGPNMAANTYGWGASPATQNSATMGGGGGGGGGTQAGGWAQGGGAGKPINPYGNLGAGSYGAGVMSGVGQGAQNPMFDPSTDKGRAGFVWQQQQKQKRNVSGPFYK